jgi:hypothetical protein
MFFGPQKSLRLFFFQMVGPRAAKAAAHIFIRLEPECG